jgi:hypothetical protein
MMTEAAQEIRLELLESQSEIIRIQSEVISDIFRLLCQYMEADELDGLPVIEKINQAASLRAEYQL